MPPQQRLAALDRQLRPLHPPLPTRLAAAAGASTAPRIGVIIHSPLRELLFTPAERAALEELGTVTWYEGSEPATVDEAIDICRECDIALGSWATAHPGSPGLLASCPKLRLWEHVAGSVNGHFTEHSLARTAARIEVAAGAAEDGGVDDLHSPPSEDGDPLRARLTGPPDNAELTIASCKTAIAEGVAELAVAYVLLGLRGAIRNAALNRRPRSDLTDEELKDRDENQLPSDARIHRKMARTSTVGIVGAGSQVGRRVARALTVGFGATVLAYDPYLDDAAAKAMGVGKVENVRELCRRCDAISLHAPSNEHTRGLISEEALKLMPDDMVLVDTTHSKIIDEHAMIAELRKGRLFALLDVSDPEPAAEDSPLRSLENVLLTSHIAGARGNGLVLLGQQAV